MGSNNTPAASELLTQHIIRGMQEKKAEDIVVMDLREIKNAVADFFILCSGNSDTQIEAISDSVEDQVFKSSSEYPYHIEGKNNLNWVLIDYIDVVAHIFNKDSREYYALENLWGDAVYSEIVNA